MRRPKSSDTRQKLRGHTENGRGLTILPRGVRAHQCRLSGVSPTARAAAEVTAVECQVVECAHANRHWPRLGPGLAQAWPRVGPELAQGWPRVGPGWPWGWPSATGSLTKLGRP